MKKVYDLKITLHPPIYRRGQGRWRLWAMDRYSLADYDARTAVSSLSPMIRRTLEKALS